MELKVSHQEQQQALDWVITKSTEPTFMGVSRAITEASKWAYIKNAIEFIIAAKIKAGKRTMSFQTMAVAIDRVFNTKHEFTDTQAS